jgi:hypothetical protein
VKNVSEIRPVKKIGSDTPASATPIAVRSKNVPRRNAESTPIATPDNSQMMAAPTARDMVTGARSSRSSQTGCLVKNE